MKKLILFLLVLSLAVSLAACGEDQGSDGGQEPDGGSAEGPAPVELPKSQGNPLVGFDGDGALTYGGDPSALVVGDTLYLYVGHDVAAGEAYNIPEYLCYSTKDLRSWNYEGVVLSMKDVSWGTPDAAWAGQCAKHYSEADGKDMYYFYYCSWDKTDSGKQSIGVAVSDSPTGPFTDIGQPLVKGSFTTDETSAWNDIDPTVWIETGEDGLEHRYLCWGNGKLYICELNEDMVTVADYDGDGEIVFGKDILSKDPPDGYTEAPWLYRRSDGNGGYTGPYYLFFAKGWRERMAYATSVDLMGSQFYWEEDFDEVDELGLPGGEQIMAPSATSNTNHMAVVEFLGKTWFIYHNGSLPKGSGFRRVACVEELVFDEDGLVEPMEETAAGPFGTVSTITALNGEALQHTPFVNSGADGDYPYNNITLGSGLRDARELDGQWEIVAGKASPEDPYTVSIESQNKAGLYVTASDAKAVLGQDWAGALAKAQTFRTVEGLAGEGVSFESVAFPGMYLTLSGGVLTMTDGSDAQASSFRVESVN